MEEYNVFNDGKKYSLNKIKSFFSRLKNIRSRLSTISEKISTYTTFAKPEVQKSISKVNEYRSECRRMKDEDFVLKTNEFIEQLRKGKKIESILPEAIAVAREATKRVLGMFPYDTQVEASICMISNPRRGTDIDGNKANIYDSVTAEMKTGEGKTLVQILTSYINLLEANYYRDAKKHKSVHVMTSNDALAYRDAVSNSRVFELLGFTCGCVLSRKEMINLVTNILRNKHENFDSLSESRKSFLIDQEIIEYKKREYAKDVVYASPSTIAFDYMHDNIITKPESRYFKKPFGFVLIDEADDILIDQATSALRLGGTQTTEDLDYERKMRKDHEYLIDLYKYITGFVYGQKGIRSKGLTYHEYDQYYKARNEVFTEEYAYCKDIGEIVLSERLQRELANIFPNVEDYNNAYFILLDVIRARHAFIKGVEYNVDIKDGVGKVVLINQNIGRKTESKYTKGMQEAIEAKEEYMENFHPNAKGKYHIEFTNQMITKAMLTYPDFLSIYEGRKSGMTGTSDEEELRRLYGFHTYCVDTRKKNIRIDERDRLYATKRDKYKAILKEVKKCRKTGQPVLIGTTSVNESIEVSEILKKNNITHNLLNAESEEIENDIIATAGLYGSVTVATNIAGRGTDIKLGPGVRELGGLLVIGTSKNKANRIDRQLRGRAARQGDPGRTIYFESLEDDLVREQYKGDLLKFLKEHYDNGEEITNKKVIKMVDRCQELIESKNKYSREVTEGFGKSFSFQRRKMYKQRDEILDASNLDIFKIIQSVINRYATVLVNERSVEEIESLIGHLVNVQDCYDSNKAMFKEKLSNRLWKNIIGRFDQFDNKNHRTYKDMLDFAAKMKTTFLNIIDVYWITHLDNLSSLQSSNMINSIGDPFNEFASESFRIFKDELMPGVYNEMITYATFPDMKFGDYQIKYSQEALQSRKILV